MCEFNMVVAVSNDSGPEKVIYSSAPWNYFILAVFSGIKLALFHFIAKCASKFNSGGAVKGRFR